jgi:tetratricopeptide (TPR) repeat protein
MGLAARGPLWLRPIVAIPVLFALWVNLDEWFILGPFTVALYLIGEVLQKVIAPIRTGDDAPAPGQLGRLGLVLVLGLAACLVNPNHVWAFQLPAEVTAWVTDSQLQFDEAFQGLFQSPLSSDYIGATLRGPNAAGIAYYLLVLLGVASFLLNFKGWRGWRMILWLGFFLPSIFLARTIAFFAVVAGPITALNFQDYGAQRFGVALRLENPWKNWSLAGRFLTLAAGAALVFLAWPGMLSSDYEDPNQSRHVAWRIEMDQSLRQATAKLAELRQDPALGEGNGFNFSFSPSSEIANYCAWFCPQEKGFFDQRFDLYPNAAGTYVKLRQDLFFRPDRTGQDSTTPQRLWLQRLSDIREKFQTHRINHLIVSGRNFEVIRPVVQPLWADTRRWTVLYMDGRTLIFGWKGLDPRPGEDPFAAHAFQPDALAFGPAVPESARAPSQGPEMAQAPSNLERYWNGPAPRSLDADASAMYVAYVDVLAMQAPAYYYAKQAAWQILSLAAPTVAANTGAYPALAWTYARISQFYAENSFRDDTRVTPAAAALLAVRSARRAIAANPTDYHNYMDLVRANEYLSASQEETWADAGLGQMRQVQKMAALQNALALKPDAMEVHLALAQVFTQLNFADYAVEHWERFLELKEASNPPPKMSAEDFTKSLENFRLLVKDRKERLGLQRLKSDYEVAVRIQTTLLRKANEAFRRGLIKKALELLVNEEDPTALQSPEVGALTMKLLIDTGRLVEAKVLAKSSGSVDPTIGYQIAAGLGDYSEAEENLEKLLDRSRKIDVGGILLLLRDQGFTFPLGSDRTMNPGPESFFAMSQMTASLRNWANIRVYQGVLALEQGDTAKATRYFQSAFKVGATPASQIIVAGAFAPGSALNAVNILELNLLDPPNRFGFQTGGVAARYWSLIQRSAPKPQNPN